MPNSDRKPSSIIPDTSAFRPPSIPFSISASLCPSIASSKNNAHLHKSTVFRHPRNPRNSSVSIYHSSLTRSHSIMPPIKSS
ncbi:hypothetical protein L596_027854 [Steinernema carpocapsae]|uniref:Uncharacterized protein n=1 Tax=Steinernema carpocapsae TaxID=34508 RepID=A0A4U5LWQ6_STECR|nr:hypothetical protein L596_027854 [Steinernema carpocapsae]